MSQVGLLSRYPVMVLVDNVLLKVQKDQDSDDAIKALKEVIKEKQKRYRWWFQGIILREMVFYRSYKKERVAMST